jgi:hypothetical protein
VLDARRNGFENDFVVMQRSAAAPVWRIRCALSRGWHGLSAR